MFYIDTTLEDLRLIAENTSGAAAGPWHTRLVAQTLGEPAPRALTSTQLAAIMFLAIDSEECRDESIVEAMYALAEPALVGLEPKLRPIP